MLEQLFVNGCILVTVIYISSQFFKNSGLSSVSPLKLKILLGILGGISANILIYFGIHITPLSTLDFRHIIIILVAFVGGLLPVLITGLICAFYRLLYIGIDYVSIISSISVLFVSIGCGVLSQTHLSKKIKLTAMPLYSLALISMVFMIVIEQKENLFVTIVSLWGSSIIVGVAVFYLVQYLDTAFRVMHRLKLESSHDFLTGLKNTRQFDLTYSDILKSSLEGKRTVSMLMIDIDNFKRVNDEHGHSTGDDVLKELGQVLLKTFRLVDSVSRIGGEEFSVILQDSTVETTLEIAERLRVSIEAYPFILPNGEKLTITVSIGAAVYPDTVQQIEALKEVSDQKLYEAKRTGRNKVCI